MCCKQNINAEVWVCSLLIMMLTFSPVFFFFDFFACLALAYGFAYFICLSLTRKFNLMNISSTKLVVNIVYCLVFLIFSSNEKTYLYIVFRITVVSNFPHILFTWSYFNSLCCINSLLDNSYIVDCDDLSKILSVLFITILVIVPKH